MIPFLPMRIHVLALGGVFDTGLATVLDVLKTADELAGKTESSRARWEVETVAVRRRVETFLGMRVPVRLATKEDHPDVVLVPALGAKMPDTLAVALQQPDIAEACSLLRGYSERKVMVAAACTATFVVAEAGVLDGRVATTSWWLAPAFRQRYPNVRLDASKLVARAGHVVTAGAALAHVDLALWLVRRQSPALAATTARYLTADTRATQAAYVIPDHLAHDDPVVNRFERWARRHLAEGFDLERAALAVRVSPRTLARRLHGVLGKTPVAYIQELRVEQALHLLQTSEASVDEIAERVGYQQGSTLRTLLRRYLGRGVREIRNDRRN